MRVPLAPLLPGVPLANATLRVSEAGLPAVPAWVRLQQPDGIASRAVLFGEVPPLLKPLQLELTAVYRENGTVMLARLPLSISVVLTQGESGVGSGGSESSTDSLG